MAQTITDGQREASSQSARWFWRYWSGSTVSALGTAVTSIALPLTAVLILHANSLEVGMVTGATYLGWTLVGLPAGVIVGKVPLRGTQIAMDLIRAAALASVPLAAVLHMLSVAQLIAVALVVSIASVVFDVGNSTFLPTVVSKEELTARNSLMSASQAVTALAGPSLGGVLVQALGATAAVLFDSVSYVLSAIMLRNLPRPERRPVARGPALSMRAQIRDGWHYVIADPVSRTCVTEVAAMNFFAGATMALVPVFLVRTLGASPALVGVLIAAEGVGSLLGAALAVRTEGRFGSARATLGAATLMPTGAALMPLATSGWGTIVFAVGNLTVPAAVVVSTIMTRTYRQRTTPVELLPQVLATVRFLSWSVIPVGSLLAGTVALWAGPRAALWLAVACSLLVPLSVWASPVRRLRDLTDEVPQALRTGIQ
ncbi:MAG: MFS transporter [Trebonia sp.]